MRHFARLTTTGTRQPVVQLQVAGNQVETIDGWVKP
jgi:hypothetical protein